MRQISMMSAISGAAVVIAAAPILYAYGRLILRLKGHDRDLVLSIFLLIAAYLLRCTYWDGVVPFLGDWQDVGVIFGLDVLNVIFNLIVAMACFLSLRALHAMIPEPDQSQWSMWTSWLYPPQWWWANTWFHDILRKK